MKIQYSPEAIEDLIRLRAFIEIKNPNAASRIAKSLIKGISQLKTFPYLGNEVELAADPNSIRDLYIGNYVARYLVQAKDIYILRVGIKKKIAYNTLEYVPAEKRLQRTRKRADLVPL